MNEKSKALREKVLALINSHPKEGLEEFYDELLDDIEAMIDALGDDEVGEIQT